MTVGEFDHDHDPRPLANGGPVDAIIVFSKLANQLGIGYELRHLKQPGTRVPGR